jgi:hypothetical protein
MTRSGVARGLGLGFDVRMKTYLIISAAETVFEFFACDADALRAAGADRVLRFDVASREYVTVGVEL